MSNETSIEWITNEKIFSPAKVDFMKSMIYLSIQKVIFEGHSIHVFINHEQILDILHVILHGLHVLKLHTWMSF